MKCSVRILRRAVRDLEEINAYLRHKAPSGAGDLLDDLLDAIESLGDFASRGATPRDDRLRGQGFRFLVQRPYLVFYKVRGRTVRVYRVLHGRRAWAALL